MTYYYRKAIELAIANPDRLFWTDNNQPDKSILGIGYVYTNASLLKIKCSATHIVVLHERSSGSQRLACVERSGDDVADIKFALDLAVQQ